MAQSETLCAWPRCDKGLTLCMIAHVAVDECGRLWSWTLDRGEDLSSGVRLLCHHLRRLDDACLRDLQGGDGGRRCGGGHGGGDNTGTATGLSENASWGSNCGINARPDEMSALNANLYAGWHRRHPRGAGDWKQSDQGS